MGPFVLDRSAADTTSEEHPDHFLLVKTSSQADTEPRWLPRRVFENAPQGDLAPPGHFEPPPWLSAAPGDDSLRVYDRDHPRPLAPVAPPDREASNTSNASLDGIGDQLSFSVSPLTPASPGNEVVSFLPPQRETGSAAATAPVSAPVVVSLAVTPEARPDVGNRVVTGRGEQVGETRLRDGVLMDGNLAAHLLGVLEESAPHPGILEPSQDGHLQTVVFHFTPDVLPVVIPPAAVVTELPAGWSRKEPDISRDEDLFTVFAGRTAAETTVAERHATLREAEAQSLGQEAGPLLATAAYLGSLKTQGPAAGEVGSLIQGPGDSRMLLAEAVQRFTEAFTRLVQQLYQKVLGRSAGGGEGEGWVQMLLQGHSEELVAGTLLGTAEFYEAAVARSGAGTPDERYLRVLHETLLGRPARDAEVSGWLGALPSLGRAGVATFLLRSQEYRVGQIELLFRTVLGREGTADEVLSWASSPLDLRAIRQTFALMADH
jgi:hypothetical protein